jgi:hypothetical protein
MSIDEAALKAALKSAIVEILEERKDLVREIFEEVIEDIALARAIQEGDQRGLVSRDEVFGMAEALSRDAEIDADPGQAISLLELDSKIQSRRN